MLVLRRFQSNIVEFKQLFTSFSHFNKIHISNALLKSSTTGFLNFEIQEKTLSFPHVWLRDNCQCDQCFHHPAKSRIIDWSTFNLSVKPKKVIKDENTVQVVWDDDHISKFSLNWLKLRSFSEEHQNKYKDIIYRPPKTTWRGDDFTKICSKHNYNDILASDQAVYNCLQQLSIYGVTLIQNAPNSENVSEYIMDRIGIPRITHYGKKLLVQHSTNSKNVAYLSSNLQLHTDLPYYENCPGINLLHYYIQTASSGGRNVLSDGHYTAAYMQEYYPEKFKLLTDVEVEWNDIGVENGKEYYKIYRSPIICLNRQNEITRTNFSVAQRSTCFPIHIDIVKPWYEAHSLFNELNRKFSAKFVTKEGELLMIDNNRLLHGRESYENQDNNIRKIFLSFIDWDEIYSKLRCLKIKLDPEDGI